MKNALPLLTAAVLSLWASSALAGDDFFVSPTGGLVGGGYFVGKNSLLSSAPTFVGRLGLRFTPAIDAELDLGWAQSTTRLRGRSYNLLDPRLNALYHFTPEHRLDLFVGGGLGFQRVEVNRDSESPNAGRDDDGLYENPSKDFIANLGPGVSFHIAGPLHARSDLRWLGSFGGDDTEAHSDVFQNVEWTIGLDLRREVTSDTDGDGLPDTEDGCPTDPEDLDGFEDQDGCPDVDNDDDGILDVDDDCPTQPEDKDGFNDQDGCADMDNDDDGLPDPDDECPDEPEDRDDFEDDDGCPDVDNDGDGVLDADDQCEGELETDNNYQDGDGCPDEIPQEVVKFTGVIEGIRFETGSDVIRRSSETVLSQALRLLQTFPEVRLQVQGHTDDQGDDDYNLDLSQRRSESVVRWFVEHGADARRLVASGFGEEQPVADNGTAAGRARNRRVEFQLIDFE